MLPADVVSKFFPELILFAVQPVIGLFGMRLLTVSFAGFYAACLRDFCWSLPDDARPSAWWFVKVVRG